MKILVICQYYYPEPFRITDICEALAKRGHEISVVTGIPNYPMGEIYEGYRNGNRRDENINGVRVHRCFTIGRKCGTIRRFLNYYSYSFSSTHYVSHLREDYDIVLVNQLSPVMMARAGIKYKGKHHKKLILYCLDLWPESLIAGGAKKNSLTYKIFHKISEKIYQQMDKILVTSKSFDGYFEKEFSISKGKITYLPQYAESLFTPEACRKEPNGMVDLMFAGNVGVAQSLETIVHAAAITKDIKNLHWHIVGDGTEIETVKKLAAELQVDSISFHGRQSLDKMPQYYSMADAMLVTMQVDPIISMTLPGKVQTYMAAGKPVIGAIDGETALVIGDAQCGIYGKAEDAEALAENVRAFMMMDRELLSRNSREYYDKHFEKQMFMDRLEIELDANDSI